jgi:HEAT repeat protein
MVRRITILLLLVVFAACSRLAVSRATKELKSPDAKARAAAAATLGKTKSRDAVAPLREALKDKDVVVRRAAATALGAIGDPAAVDDLLTAAGDPNTSKDAQAALAAIGPAAEPRLLETLKTPNAKPAAFAARALGAMKSAKAVDALIPMAADPKIDSSCGYAAREALGQIGGAKSEQAMIERAKSPDAAVRKLACDTLGRLKSRDAVPLLIERLGDADGSVATEAARALGNVGDARAVDPLFAILRRPHKKDDDLQKAAGGALGKIGAPAVDRLLAALDDKDDFVRTYAAVGLGESKDARAIPALVRHLGDEYGESSSLQFEVGQALNKIGPQGVTAVLDAAKNGNERTRSGAVNALGNSSDPRALPALLQLLHDKSHEVRSSVGFFLAFMSLDDSAHKYLSEAVQKKDLVVVEAAMPYYINRGIPGSEPVLIAAMNAPETESNLTVPNLFLNSGNPTLEQAARKWADKHGWSVSKEKSENTIQQRWGSAR